MTVEHYYINIFYSDEDDTFVADIPDLRYCTAFGETPEHALSEVLVAQRLWLDGRRAGRRYPHHATDHSSSRWRAKVVDHNDLAVRGWIGLSS